LPLRDADLPPEEPAGLIAGDPEDETAAVPDELPAQVVAATGRSTLEAVLGRSRRAELEKKIPGRGVLHGVVKLRDKIQRSPFFGPDG